MHFLLVIPTTNEYFVNTALSSVFIIHPKKSVLCHLKLNVLKQISKFVLIYIKKLNKIYIYII